MVVNAAGNSEPAYVKEDVNVQDRLGKFIPYLLHYLLYLHLFVHRMLIGHILFLCNRAS